jgi:type IV pilus biogenesis protein PilP
MFSNMLRQNTGNQAQAQTDGSQETLNNIEAQINERMQALVARLSSPTRAPVSEELTVDDLDMLRREAERAQATLALREAEFQEIEAELEMLSLLQTTLAEIRASNSSSTQTAQSEQPAVDVEALRAQWEAERAAEERTRTVDTQPDQNAAAEQQVIPRLVSIKGSGGRFEAEVESARGVIQYVTPGDALADGFVVESIDPKGVVIKGQLTNTRYSLIPSPPVNREEEQATSSFDIPIARPMGIVD